LWDRVFRAVDRNVAVDFTKKGGSFPLVLEAPQEAMAHLPLVYPLRMKPYFIPPNGYEESSLDVSNSLHLAVQNGQGAESEEAIKPFTQTLHHCGSSLFSLGASCSWQASSVGLFVCTGLSTEEPITGHWHWLAWRSI